MGRFRALVILLRSRKEGEPFLRGMEEAERERERERLLRDPPLRERE